MSSTLNIDGKIFLCTKDAAESFPYSTDHLTRLAKQKKITALQISRRWYVQEDSLRNYAEVQQMEAAVRRKHLVRSRQAEALIASLDSRGVNAAVFHLSANHVALWVGCAVFALVSFFGFQASGVWGATLVGTDQQFARVSQLPGIVSEGGESVLEPMFSSENVVHVAGGRQLVHPAAANEDIIFTAITP